MVLALHGYKNTCELIQHCYSFIQYQTQVQENKHATAQYFQIDRKRFREWLQEEDDLKKLQGNSKKRHLGRRLVLRKLDEAVLDFLMEERAAGRPVSNKELRSKALNLSHGFAVPSTFKAFPMWLK